MEVNALCGRVLGWPQSKLLGCHTAPGMGRSRPWGLSLLRLEHRRRQASASSGEVALKLSLFRLPLAAQPVTWEDSLPPPYLLAVSNLRLLCFLAFRLPLPRSFQWFCRSLISRCPAIPTTSPRRRRPCPTRHGLQRGLASPRLSEFLNLLRHASRRVLPHVSQTFTPIRIHLVFNLLSEKMAALANALLLRGNSFSCFYHLFIFSWDRHSQK